MTDKLADFSLCMICRKHKNENLVNNPSTREKVVKYIEWGRYGDLRYFKLWLKLKSVSIDELKEEKASWHRSCFQDTVHCIIKESKGQVCQYYYCLLQNLF